MPKITSGDQVIIKVLAAAICGSDLHITSVPQSHPCDIGTTIGHECIAEVYEIGENVKNYKKGDRVAVDPIIPCGDCAQCKNGHYNMCTNLTALGVQVNGVFAPYCVVTQDKLYPVPEDMPFNRAIFIEMLACIMNGAKRLKVSPGMEVLIFGAGPIGMTFVEVMKALGAGKVFLSEALDSKLELAKERSNADYVMDAKDPDVYTKIKELSNGGPQIVIDTVGVLLPQAVDVVSCEGQILLFGINDHVEQHFHQYDITRKEITIVSSYATHYTFDVAIRMLASGVINVDKIITHEVTMDEINEAMDICRSGHGLKVAVKMS